MQSGGGNTGMKKLLLCLIIVSICFFCVGFASEDWWTGFFGFFVNIFILIGFIIGLISPPQPMIYIISCIVEAIFVFVSLGIAIFFFVAAGYLSGSASTGCIVAGVFYLLDAFICGAIAFFCFQVYKTGG